jgi:hypothetical protein
MLRSINLIANTLITLGGTAFYLMLFTRIGNGAKQIDRFSRVSYYSIKASLALVITGAFLNVLIQTVPPMTEVLMNAGLGGIFVWAALWHGQKFGVIIGVKAIDRKTGAYRVPTRVEDVK